MLVYTIPTSYLMVMWIFKLEYFTLTLMILSHLTTNSAGYIGNLIGAALYWRPSLNTTNADGSYNVISANYLNPKQLLDSYDDSTNTKRLLANFNVSLNLSDKLTFRTIFGVDRSTSTREAQLLPSIDILGHCSIWRQSWSGICL